MLFVGKAESLSEEGLAASAALLGVDKETILTIIEVETSGCGFLRDKRPVILFERHVFSKQTGGKFDEYPNISSPSPGGYGPPGEHQYRRLEQAIAISLDEEAALKSASWGLGQIMGYNAKMVGYRTNGVRGMVATFADSEDAQVMAVAQFCLASGLADKLRRQDWQGFANGYNGPGFHKNNYDNKLAAAYARLRNGNHHPDLTVRAEQLRMLFAGLYDGPIDGIIGPRTLAARAAAAA